MEAPKEIWAELEQSITLSNGDTFTAEQIEDRLADLDAENDRLRAEKAELVTALNRIADLRLENFTLREAIRASLPDIDSKVVLARFEAVLAKHGGTE